MSHLFYTAPTYFDEDNYRTVGMSSSIKGPVIPGARYMWPDLTPVQLVTESTPVGWTRMELAAIPAGQVDPGAIYAILCIDGDFTKVTPDEVYQVVDAAGADPSWQRFEVAIIDPVFWAQYGGFYNAPGSGKYVPADYRATVRIPHGRESMVPPSWVQLSREEAQARHPAHDVDRIDANWKRPPQDPQ